MNNCIYFCIYGDLKYHQILKLSLQSLQDKFNKQNIFVFTDKINSELENLCTQVQTDFPKKDAAAKGYRLILGQKLLKTYDNILYLDIDTICVYGVQNIFSAVQDNQISFASEKSIDSYKITKETHAGPLMSNNEKELYKDVNSFCTGVFLCNKTVKDKLSDIYNYIIDVDNSGFLGICGEQHAFTHYVLKHSMYNYGLQNFVNGDAYNNFYLEKKYTIQHFAWNDTLENKLQKIRSFFQYIVDYKKIKKKISTRNELLNTLPTNLKIAELGVFRGEFSKLIKQYLKPEELFLVDIFPKEMWSADKDGYNMICLNLEPIYTELVTYFKNDETVKVIKKTTKEFLMSLPDKYLDMVYIDADHSYEAVKQDLELSLKKVKDGGIIAGHDYAPAHPGVVRAINEFCNTYNREIAIVTEDGCPTFIIYNKEKNHKTTSLVVACKDREECLQAVIQSWLQYDTIDEIVIVDWSSRNSLDFFTQYSPKIKVIRVENESYYIPSQANNLGVLVSTGENILRVDTDYFFNPYYNFFETYSIDDATFVSGEPEVNSDRENNPYYKYLFGLLYITRENFNKVNGYSENIGYYYSHEDSDIFNRLKLLGLTQIKLQNNHSVIHIPHPDKKRYENFEGAPKTENDEFTTVETHIGKNLQSYKQPKHFYTSPKVNWDIKHINSQYYEAKKKANPLCEFPTVNCISLEESFNRRETLLKQFKQYGINYINFLTSKRYSESKDKVEGKFVHTLNDGTAGCCVSHLKNIKRWYDTTDEQYGFFCEDDLSLQTVPYWDKSWNEFLHSLPNDWECVQLLTIRKDNLSPILRNRIWDDWSATAYILKREFAQKILNTYIHNDIYRLELPDPNSSIQPLIENLLFTIGKTYTIPLFVENINFESTFVETDKDVDQATLHKNNHVIAAQKTLEQWKYKTNDLYNFAVDIEEPENNLKMGLFYLNQGHTAPALSYFLRCAERTENKLLAYEALIFGYLCYKEQKIRDETAKSLIMHAVCLIPERPEARWLLSSFYEQKQYWMDSYYQANRGLEKHDQDVEELKYYKQYPGKHALLFQKAISGYWWGKNEECKSILLDLYHNYQLCEIYKQSVKDNLKKIGIEIS